MSATCHIRIKEEYAAAIIEDLRKKDAVESVSENEAFDVPQWQKDVVRKRIATYKSNPDQFIDEEPFLPC